MYRAASGAKKFGLSLLLVISALLVGCASSGKKTTDTETAYYEAAQTYLEKRNFSLAIDKLNTLQTRFPFGRYATISQLDLMYAQYQLKRYSDALLAADRFTRLNSGHPNSDYAWFIRSMSYYQLFLANRGIFNKADPATRSAEQGKKAFDALSQFTLRYPDSDYRDEALKAQVILKDALARHELIVADYYVRRGAWIAAAERAQTIIYHYPGVASVADAYVILIESYAALDMPEDHDLALNKLKAHYPDHPTLATGEYKAPKWEEDRWWLKVLTLGLKS